MENLSKNKIKQIRALRLKKNRQNENLFIVEGAKMVQELMDHWGAYISLICSTDSAFQSNHEYYIVDERTMKELSLLSTPSSLLAVVRFPKFDSVKSSFILAIDGVQDPGNMGTIIRTADWFGVDKIVCSKETVDIFNPKVIQSSMGSLFRMPVEYVDLPQWLATSSQPIYGALLGGTNLHETKLSNECIVLVGNEGNGISPEAEKHVDHPVLIPGTGGAESLNVAVATGILLNEFSK